MRSISAFAYRHRKTEKNLCRGDRSQDLPNTDFQRAVRHVREKQQYTHSTANTHKMTKIYTIQLQQYHKETNNNTHKTANNNTHNTPHNTTCTNGKQHHGKNLLYIVSSNFPTHTVLTLSPQPFTSHHFTAHINFSHKVTFHFTSLHITSLHFTSLQGGHCRHIHSEKNNIVQTVNKE